MQTFEEWFVEVKQFVKANHPIYLLGGPDPDFPDPEPIPLSDEQVEAWGQENRQYFEKYYKDGDTPQWALVEFVAG
jgi:hypothetical protein